ncbi:MAG: hypothetical protein AAFR65_05015 [Pseudomonadota bacterium]
MESQFALTLGAAAVVILGTFFVKTALGTVIRLGGLAGVAYMARRPDDTEALFSWLTSSDLQAIGVSAVFGLLVAMIMNAFVWREDGFGRHFFTPMLAVAASFLASWAYVL